MRLYVARNIGTDTWIEEPVTPYINIETGLTETTTWRYDAKRPDAVLEGECRTTLVNWRNAERWIVLSSADVAPVGTYDVGDPTDHVFLASTPSNPERRTIEQELGVASGTLSGMTWRQVMADALSHTDRWRALFTTGDVVLVGDSGAGEEVRPPGHPLGGG